MSEQHLEEDLGIELGASADELFGNVFAAISPETFGEEAAEGDDPAGTPAGSAGSATAADQSAGAGTPAAAAGSAGAGGEPLVPANGGAEGTPAATEPGDGSDVGTVAYADIQSAFGEISNALEDNATRVNQEAALRELQAEQTKYFDAIKLHPRMLVGQEVPSLNGDGMETLRDSKDAQDWQEAVKELLLISDTTLNINFRYYYSFKSDPFNAELIKDDTVFGKTPFGIFTEKELTGSIIFRKKNFSDLIFDLKNDLSTYLFGLNRVIVKSVLYIKIFSN